MSQAHTGIYVALLATENMDYPACHPEKTTTYILHVIPITTHTYVRLKSIGKKKRKEKKQKRGKNKRQDKKRKQGKETKKNAILADPMN